MQFAREVRMVLTCLPLSFTIDAALSRKPVLATGLHMDSETEEPDIFGHLSRDHLDSFTRNTLGSSFVTATIYTFLHA